MTNNVFYELISLKFIQSDDICAYFLVIVDSMALNSLKTYCTDYASGLPKIATFYFSVLSIVIVINLSLIISLCWLSKAHLFLNVMYDNVFDFQ